ncbi:alpha beta hydrolase fold protein [Nannochloropsis gaditana CCMP526]|uniref:alpha beta hydrolase fold protein n=1 Tax=Nannochloropsis gaditana (strain CCMP526) TaxID=1093141 RepID=UPI00029F6F59|nr:alpha beta hydrolase fold protein [Nannochloropsis gaditana CCMP526]EKU21339.1 alpha beta hydrolase fold protein [Nannochloropsis gaditana CCMP526]|eukprot:XP_005855027.1 alpha beta hydrolase fold protein [Nannochloropsis gaditana CCMP526]
MPGNPLPRDVHLFGHDWGAVLAYILARKGSREKVRVTSVVTVAVPHEAARGFLTHPRQFLNSWYMLFIQLPFLPEFWFRAGGRFWGLHQLWGGWSPGYTLPPSHLASLHATFSEPGVLMSSMQYYRDNVPGMLLEILKAGLGRGGSGTEGEEERKEASVVAAPTLALSGLNDGCIDPVLYDVAMGLPTDGMRVDHPLFPAGVRVMKLEGGGHFLHREKAEEVNDLAVAWFKKHSKMG